MGKKIESYRAVSIIKKVPSRGVKSGSAWEKSEKTKLSLEGSKEGSWAVTIKLRNGGGDKTNCTRAKTGRQGALLSRYL